MAFGEITHDFFFLFLGCFNWKPRSHECIIVTLFIDLTPFYIFNWHSLGHLKHGNYKVIHRANHCYRKQTDNISTVNHRVLMRQLKYQK